MEIRRGPYICPPGGMMRLRTYIFLTIMIHLGHPSFSGWDRPTCPCDSRRAPRVALPHTSCLPPRDRDPFACRPWVTLSSQSTNLYWRAASRWAHAATIFSCVSDICCICFIWMFKSRSAIAYVAMAIHICCKCRFQMFQLFQTYVASVLSGCCICCNDYTRMLQVYVSTVLNLCCKCFYLDVADIALAIHVCYKCMFQIFQLFQSYVASVLSKYCSGHTQMLQAYVCKCFICFGCMLQQMLYVAWPCAGHR
jgi:hypothetical protein